MPCAKALATPSDNMAYEPDFMTRFDHFSEDIKQLKNEQDWLEFRSKWLDQTDWPHRKKPFDQPTNRTVQSLQNRIWVKSFWAYDLSPEARYEYFSVLLGVGMDIRFPHLKRPDAQNLAKPWTLYCPYCEIVTEQPGSQQCPICDRDLLFDYLED